MNPVSIQLNAVMWPREGKSVDVLRHPLLVAMAETFHRQISDRTLSAIPSSMASETHLNCDVCCYSDSDWDVTPWKLSHTGPSSWICISQGNLIHEVDEAKVVSVLSHSQASIVCLGVDERLVGHREQIRYACDGSVLGFRRYYEDSVVVTPTFEDWPHRVYVRSSCLQHFASIPIEFGAFNTLCRTHHLDVQSYDLAGWALDLNTASGQVDLVRYINRNQDSVRGILNSVQGYQCLNHAQTGPASRPTVIGQVWVSKSAKISPTAKLISPVVVSDHSMVASEAVLESCIIEAGAHVEENAVVSRNASDEPLDTSGHESRMKPLWGFSSQNSRFRQWPGWAYVNTVKRIVDIVIACAVIVVFLPVFPAIALAIKINSPGPVFYKARRQGLHGKEFDCLKYRTMKVGSDQLQDKLRAINEVDGPQFKMADDPRISAVGGFLRETYLDEIPQFVNVLKGEMSVVGPRPSPKSENTQCPRWRDARLSVRPGITGLWQLLRTREPLRDFQEWIHYDIDYVKRVSVRLDMWIFWKTFQQMLGKFSEQF